MRQKLKKYERHLTDRDRAVLAFVERYRVSTVGLAALAVFKPSDSHLNVTRVLNRLVRRGLLRAEGFDEFQEYYTLRARGYSVLGMTPITPRPLTEQSLPAVLAEASYCVRNGLTRLKRREFAKKFPELTGPGMRSTSYVLVNTEQGPKLQMLLVDRGGGARRLKAKIHRVKKQRIDLPGFASLMKAGRFQVKLLTGTLAQESKIKRVIAANSFDLIEVSTAVIPELADVLLLRR